MRNDKNVLPFLLQTEGRPGRCPPTMIKLDLGEPPPRQAETLVTVVHLRVNASTIVTHIMQLRSGTLRRNGTLFYNNSNIAVRKRVPARL